MPYVFQSDGYPEADEFSNNYQWIDTKSPTRAELSAQGQLGPGIVQAKPRADATTLWVWSLESGREVSHVREQQHGLLTLLRRFLEWLPNSVERSSNRGFARS